MEKLTWENYSAFYYKSPQAPFIRYTEKTNRDGTRQKCLIANCLINNLELGKKEKDCLLSWHNSFFIGSTNSTNKFFALDLVGDLLQKSELELFKVFGYDNDLLISFKIALYKAGLSLDTKLSQSTQDLLEQKRDSLTIDERAAYSIPQLFATVVAYTPTLRRNYKCY